MTVRLDDLEPELVQLILEYVNDSSPRTTKAVALVSKYLNAASKAIQHRHKVIDLKHNEDGGGGMEKIETLFQDELALRSIHVLTIEDATESEGYGGTLADFEKHWQPLANVISKIGKLRALIWKLRSAFPGNVLKALHEHHPRASLRILNYQRFNANLTHLDHTETALSRSPALTHFRAEILGQPVPDYRLTALRRLIATPPNLRYVGMIVQHMYSTDSGDDKDNNPDSLPDINDTSFKRPNSSVRTFTFDCPEATLSKGMLEAWKDVLDISKLESVKFSRGFPMIDYFQNAPAMLPNLKHLSLNFSPIIGCASGPNPNPTLQAANSYLRNCPALRSLSLWSWMRVTSLSELLDRHAFSLRSLQLHEKEGPGSLHVDVPNTRIILSLEDLEAIRTRCVNLSSLTFDMNREDKDFNLAAEKRNTLYVQKLASFKASLKKLQIYFDSCGLHDLFHSYTASQNDQRNEDNADEAVSDDIEGAQIEEEGTSQQNMEARTVARDQEHSTTVDEGEVGPPPSKRARTKQDLVPPEDLMKSYAEAVWKAVFGARKTSRGKLCIKFGEWESKMSFPWEDTRRVFKVRPHDRDDMQGQCVTTMKQR